MAKTEKPLDPMLVAALERLTERGPKWDERECARWIDLFVSTVQMLYPARAPRKSRAKKGQDA